MRWAPPVAATVPASVEQAEPEVANWVGLLDRRILPARWPAQGNKKEQVTNSVLEISQSILLGAGLHHGLSERWQTHNALP